MEIINLDNQQVVVGLEWSAVHLPTSEASEKKALSEYLKKNKGHGVILRHQGYVLAGKTEDKVSLPKGALSGAALLGLANQLVSEQQEELISNYSQTPDNEYEDKSSSDYNLSENELMSSEFSGGNSWIFVERVETVKGSKKNKDVQPNGHQDLFWLCVIKNGVPIPGGDIVGEKDDIINEILEILSTSSNFTVFTTDKDVRFNVVGQSTVVEKKFSDIIRGVETKKAKITLFSLNKLIALGVIIFVVLLIGIWWGYSSWYTSRQEALARQKAAAAAQAKKQQITSQTNQYKDKIKKVVYDALDTGMNNLKTSVFTPSPNKVIHSWLNIIYGVNLYQGGWDINGITCGLDNNKPYCTVLLKANNLSTNRLLLEEHPNAEIEKEKATYTIYLDKIDNRKFKLSSLPSFNTFNKGLLSDIQSLSLVDIQYSLNPSSEIIKTVTLPPPPSLIPQILKRDKDKKEKSYSIKLGFAKGAMSVTGNTIWQLNGLSKIINKNNVVLDSFVINIDPNNIDHSNWVLKYNYYLHTSKNPDFPNIKLGDKKINFELPNKYK